MLFCAGGHAIVVIAYCMRQNSGQSGDGSAFTDQRHSYLLLQLRRGKIIMISNIFLRDTSVS